MNNGGTLDLNGTTQAVANLRSGSGTQLAGGTIINSNATTAATLAVALNANQTWAGNISNGQTIGTITGNEINLTGTASGGTLNFVRDGNNTLTVNSPNTLGGSVAISGGATRLIDLGTFQNASSITVTHAALIWNDTGTQAVSNRLLSTAPITLTGGGFQFVSRAGTGANPVDAISLGTLNIGVGASVGRSRRRSGRAASRRSPSPESARRPWARRSPSTAATARTLPWGTTPKSSSPRLRLSPTASSARGPRSAA